MEKHAFGSSDTPVAISAGPPSNIRSTQTISGLPGQIVHMAVAIDIDHSWTSDLNVRLSGPDGSSILLVGGEGGSGDHFRFTIFDDRSGSSVRNANPPFRGTFAPEDPLATFTSVSPNGDWTLEVEDSAPHDGGNLNAWFIAFDVEEAAPAEQRFFIDVEFAGGLTTTQQQVFAAAGQRWQEVIVADPDIGSPDGESRLTITAQGIFIDGASGTLGQAAPTHVWTNSGLPARGIMSFDTADLASMEADGSLLDVIVHEMGHVIGIGTLWSNLLQGAGTTNPEFLGQNAMREFAAFLQQETSLPVPVANQNGPGTADSHWRENVFVHELMTGFLNAGVNPISRLTIASLEDLGYAVNYQAADQYVLPNALMAAIMGAGGDAGSRRERCCVSPPAGVMAIRADA